MIFFRPLFTLFFFVLTLCSTAAQNQKFTFQRPKMGSPFLIIAYANDSLKLAEVVEKAYARVDTLNQIFSDYSGTSEISVLAKNYKKNEWISVSQELLKILMLSQKAAQASHGAYDVTVGNIVKLWRKARKDKHPPNAESLKIALSKTGFKHIEIEEKTAKICFNTEGVLLDFGGIVKGYAAQEVVRILTESGFPICLADAGGDLAIGEKPQKIAENSLNMAHPDASGTEGWLIGISIPQSNNQLLPTYLSLKNQAVATSGDMYNFIEFEGKRYSHIVNPKTGMGVTHQRNVTVIAPDGALADWLATACSVLPIKKALRLIKHYPNTALLIVEKRKRKIEMWQSKGF